MDPVENAIAQIAVVLANAGMLVSEIVVSIAGNDIASGFRDSPALKDTIAQIAAQRMIDVAVCNQTKA